jgi:hypothetical protein
MISVLVFVVLEKKVFYDDAPVLAACALYLSLS